MPIPRTVTSQLEVTNDLPRRNMKLVDIKNILGMFFFLLPCITKLIVHRVVFRSHMQIGDIFVWDQLRIICDSRRPSREICKNSTENGR